MRREGIYARLGKRSRSKRVEREIEVMENLLKQEAVEVTATNQLYYADITLILQRGLALLSSSDGRLFQTHRTQARRFAERLRYKVIFTRFSGAAVKQL